jgi:hypothetical protein
VLLPRIPPRAGDDGAVVAIHDLGVTRDKTIERVSKLRAVTVQRGASPYEAATAAVIAARLSARLAVDAAGATTPAPGLHATGDRRSPRSLRFVAFA